jgi:hypothetical protein
MVTAVCPVRGRREEKRGEFRFEAAAKRNAAAASVLLKGNSGSRQSKITIYGLEPELVLKTSPSPLQTKVLPRFNVLVPCKAISIQVVLLLLD